jgi:hypothetical protein
MEPIWAQHPSDPALGTNIGAAWEHAMKVSQSLPQL